MEFHKECKIVTQRFDRIILKNIGFSVRMNFCTQHKDIINIIISLWMITTEENIKLLLYIHLNHVNYCSPNFYTFRFSNSVRVALVDNKLGLRISSNDVPSSFILLFEVAVSPLSIGRSLLR